MEDTAGMADHMIYRHAGCIQKHRLIRRVTAVWQQHSEEGGSGRVRCKEETEEKRKM